MTKKKMKTTATTATAAPCTGTTISGCHVETGTVHHTPETRAAIESVGRAIEATARAAEALAKAIGPPPIGNSVGMSITTR